jgi:hypothetical protein
MGTDALLTSGVTEKMLYFIRDKRSIELSNPLNKVRKSRILMFLAVELIGFGATFAVTQVCLSPRLVLGIRLMRYIDDSGDWVSGDYHGFGTDSSLFDTEDAIYG